MFLTAFKLRLDRYPLLWIVLGLAVVLVDMALVKGGYALSWQRLVLPLLSASFFSEYAQPG